MVPVFVLIISIVIIFLAYFKLFYPYNGVITKISLGIFIISIVMIAAPQTLTLSQEEPFTISVVDPPVNSWSQISGIWNSERTIVTIPIVANSTGSFLYNQTSLEFSVKPNCQTYALKDDTNTMHVEIHNYSAKVVNYPFLYRSRGIYYANISDPSGKWSGDDYQCDYSFQMSEYGTFRIDFKFNSETKEFSYTGQSIDMEIIFSDYKNFEKSYMVNFVYAIV